MLTEGENHEFYVTEKQLDEIEEWKLTLPKIKKDKKHPGYSYMYSHGNGIGWSLHIVRNDKPKKYKLDLTDYSRW